MNSEKFEGRRGQKRLREIRMQTEAFKDETDCRYEDSPEMLFMEEQVGWDEIARLHYALAMKNVHFKWKGIKDYGFIRLSSKWIRGKKIQSMTQKDVADLVSCTLPADLVVEIQEETAALEIE